MLARKKTEEINLTENTFLLYKIELNNYYTPLKLVFRYKGSTDLKVFYSRTCERPADGSCEHAILEPSQILITDDKKAKFSTGQIYFNFSTNFGVSFNVTASFPNQD